MLRKIMISIIVLGLVVACKQQQNHQKQEPVARVYNKFLYKDDIKDIVNKSNTEADSISMVKDYIDNWVFKQLMLHEAEQKLSEDDKDVAKQIEDYRTSLLIFKYEQNYIRKNIDTVITSAEIEAYYQQYSSNFILNQHIVKAMLVKLPGNAPKLWTVRSWFRSDSPEDLTKLEQYCFENNGQIVSFDKKWYEFSKIQKYIPQLPYATDYFLRNRNTVELKENDYVYLLRIYDYNLEGSVAPMEHTELNIQSIILNKRKLNLLNKLESEIYNNALDRGNFNTY